MVSYIFNKISKYVIGLILFFVITLGSSSVFNVSANTGVQDTKYKGTVSEVLKVGSTEYGPNYQELKIKLEDSSEITVENNPQTSARNIKYSVGDKVILQRLVSATSETETPVTQSTYIITDYNRISFLTLLLVIFIVLALMVGKRQGFYSLVGMAFSFFVIFKFILPEIIKGNNPILVTVVASLFIIPVNFYLSHGFSNKTHAAIASTVLTMILTSFLTGLSVQLAKLTGYSSDEAMFLQIAHESIDIRGVLLAGIIIGFLGILDDVTVAQASLVAQLSKVKKYKDVLDLYSDAMTVGRDHITSMINTLVLVYAGASLPLLLLFINNPQPWVDVVNLEIVAEEIVRTLIGSIGLILAVPLSTLISALFADDLEA
jgi:uncharacterized membrane protein